VVGVGHAPQKELLPLVEPSTMERSQMARGEHCQNCGIRNICGALKNIS